MPWPQNKDEKQKDQFRFTFQQPSYQQNPIPKPAEQTTSNPAQPSANLITTMPKPQLSKLALTQSQQQQQRQKQKSQPANYNQFYQTMRLYRQDIPQAQFVPYQKTVKTYQRTKNIFDFLFLGYLFAVLYNTQKKWYKLTARTSTTILSIVALIFAPNYIYQRKMDRFNYDFYQKNKTLLDSILTKEDKVEIKLADLLQKYQ